MKAPGPVSFWEKPWELVLIGGMTIVVGFLCLLTLGLALCGCGLD